MRMRRLKVSGASAVYHCMTRTVNGEMLFKDREKEMLRKMVLLGSAFSYRYFLVLRLGKS